MFLVLMGCSMFVAAKKDEEKVRCIVLFKDQVDKKIVEDNNGVVLDTYDIIPGLVADLTKSDIKELKKSDKVKSVEEDAQASILGSKDEDADQQVKAAGGKPAPAPKETLPWGVDRIDADIVWAGTDATTGNGIKVAVMDTGIDNDHPDLKAIIKGGTNTITSGGSYDDDNGHGTHCAGIIAAQHNGEGVKGVAPKIELYSIKVLNRQGNGWYSDFIEGLQWAITNKMQVVSMSFGGTGDDAALHAACDQANAAGIILVAAAGNEGRELVLYPAAYSTVIAVSATTTSDALASYSSYGSSVDFAAPGSSIYSTYKGGGYATMSGTSMACPHVAGVAALVWGKDKTHTGAEVVTALLQAENLGTPGWDKYYGWGLVDAENAYKSV